MEQVIDDLLEQHLGPLRNCSGTYNKYNDRENVHGEPTDSSDMPSRIQPIVPTGAAR